MATTSSLAPKATIAHSEFTTEPLNVDAETATEIVRETVHGVTATETAEGRKFRTPDGMLIAILTPGPGADPTVDLHYRTAPSSAVATLKARKIWRALAPYAG